MAVIRRFPAPPLCSGVTESVEGGWMKSGTGVGHLQCNKSSSTQLTSAELMMRH